MHRPHHSSEPVMVDRDTICRLSPTTYQPLPEMDSGEEEGWEPTPRGCMAMFAGAAFLAASGLACLFVIFGLQ